MKYTLLIILSLILSTNKVFAQIETRYFQNRDALDSLYKQKNHGVGSNDHFRENEAK